MKQHKRTHVHYALGLSILLLFTIGLGLRYRLWVRSGLSSDRIVEQVIRKCIGSTNAPFCYKETIPKAVLSMSLRDGMEVVKMVQAKDKKFLYCHDVAHILGTNAVKKDRNQRRSILSNCQFGMCANGCLHGVVQEIVKGQIGAPITDAVKQHLGTICLGDDTWKPNTFEKSHCYMAMGSVINYFTYANIRDSLILCDQITSSTDGIPYARLCYDGVFDQVYRPQEQEDSNLVRGKAPTKEGLFLFCAQYSKDPFGPLKKSSCLNQGWPLYRNEVNTPAGLEHFCQEQDDADGRESCYKVLFQRVAPNNNNDIRKIARFCSQISNELQGMCLAASSISMTVSDIELQAKAKTICDQTTDSVVSSKCRSIVAEYMNATEDQRYCAPTPNILKK